MQSSSVAACGVCQMMSADYTRSIFKVYPTKVGSWSRACNQRVEETDIRLRGIAFWGKHGHKKGQRCQMMSADLKRRHSYHEMLVLQIYNVPMSAPQSELRKIQQTAALEESALTSCMVLGLRPTLVLGLKAKGLYSHKPAT